MIELNKTSASDDIYCTALELSQAYNTHLLFCFENVLNKRKICVLFDKLFDQSLNKNRYSLFKINTFVSFFNEQVGRWHYRIREQQSSANIIEELSGNIIEEGVMKLYDNIYFDHKKYTAQQHYIAYDQR
jgi:hypothetical protein